MAPVLRGYGKECRELLSDFITLPRAEEVQYHEGSARGGCIRTNPGLRIINLH